MEQTQLLLDRLETLPAVGRRQLQKLKKTLAKETGQPLLRNDQLLERYRLDLRLGRRLPDRDLEEALVLNAIRSRSGVATVTVLTKPYPCPGRCIYCPTETKVPKSYLSNEPAVMRAIQNDYDPYRQVMTRLAALDNTGHATTKVELIVKGGTWSFYSSDYQRWFIQRCLEAANEFDEGPPPSCFDELSMNGGKLLEAQERNETAKHRIVGITIETRPDHVTGQEILRLRELGVTRVELGVQTLEDRILNLTLRDHGILEVAQATQLLRDAGFKVAYHLMPNLPGATPEDDIRTFKMLFGDPAYRPDAIKIYPCVVVESAELYHLWREGGYRPYDEETLLDLIVQLKEQVPPYVRIERVIRDIPSTSIVAGCKTPNLRDEVMKRMRAMGLSCRCIRCRQVTGPLEGEFLFTRRDYEASGGAEIFLSFENPAADRLAALLRLRIPSSQGPGFVRELHTYGWHLPLHNQSQTAAQHRGFGRRLMEEAEKIAFEEFGISRIAVIAGVGVREYYRRLGYRLSNTYMVKDLPQKSAAT
jgi:elongator complex protein 3